MTKEQLALLKIFFPHAMQEMNRVRDTSRRFAHYTSADTGLRILRSGRLLLRNSNLMNDFSEVHHGLSCLLDAYNNSPLGSRLQNALHAVQLELPKILEANFNAQIQDLMRETYLLSVSEHGDPKGDPEGDKHEDRFGRLSMWRAYAPKDGIALIMKYTPFLCESPALGAFTSPVTYKMPDEFQTTFEEVVAAIEDNIDAIKQLDWQHIHDILMVAFRFMVQSTKHPSFKEEREWRVIYSPSIIEKENSLTERQKARIPCEVMSLGGVPQRVFSIPFIDYPDEGFVGATIPDLIDRVLIGPSQDSNAIYHAFVHELKGLNVTKAESKVVITGVPLRQ